MSRPAGGDASRRARARHLVRHFAAVFGAVLAVVGFAQGGWVEAKAALAQVLLNRAWDRTRATGEPERPWPWADTVPVARLQVPRLDVAQIVLSGSGGRSLSFGPSMSGAGALPGEPGTVVISAHRDTHFGFLRELLVGDHIWLDTGTAQHAYVIVAFRVVDARREGIAVDGDDALLKLVTCYPFDAIDPGGPLRYVVSARLAGSERPTSWRSGAGRPGLGSNRSAGPRRPPVPSIAPGESRS